MKYFIRIALLSISANLLFSVSNQYTSEDSREKLKQYDTEKAQENQHVVDLNNTELKQKEKLNNSNHNKKQLLDLDVLKLELKEKEFSKNNLTNNRLTNNNPSRSNRDCDSAGGYSGWLGDGSCDVINNIEECGWDSGDCCPGDCVDASWLCSDYGGNCDDCLNPDSADNATDGQCYEAGPCGNQFQCWDGSCAETEADCPLTCEEQGLVTCSDGSCGATEEDCVPENNCDDGYVQDCVDDDCCSAGWIGDGFADCEDQAWGCDLTCYDNDGGDCIDCGDYNQVTCWDESCADFEDECPETDCSNIDLWDVCGQYVLLYGYTCQYTESFGYDCSFVEECELCPWVCEDDGLVTCWDNSCAETQADCPEAGCAESGGIESWIADGYCDSSNNNANCDWDGGDCCGSTCLASTYDCVGSGEGSYGACYNQCLDPDANDDCCEDNTCPFTCEGNGLITCWDSSCAESEADCPEVTCADTECSWYIATYTCPEIEQNFGYDCSVCEEEGACPLTCEDQGLITCFSGECAASEDECNGCENPGEAVEGSNYSEGYDEFYSFTATEGGFITLSTAGAGIDTKLYLYPANCDIATTFDDFDSQYIAYNDDWGSSQYGTCPDCTYSLESYIYVGIPAGDYIIVSSDTYNSAHNPFEWTLAFEVGIEGCTNETANNYDPEANIDDGTCEFDDGVYFVTCDGGSWQTEVSWDLTDEDTGDIVLSGGAPFEGSAALAPGRYYVHALDSYGDGWNGNIWTIIDSESNEVLSYTLEEGSEGMSESFTVEATGCPFLGDVNGDEQLNVVDIVAIVNGILGQSDLEEVIFCGDFNQDGFLNVVDVVGIVNAILGS